METRSIKLNPSWLTFLKTEFDKPYMITLKQFLENEYKRNKVIYPKGTHYFEALNRTSLDSVKVVILGQDPYHGEGQAHGLSFSVPKGIKPPPSLINIFKEIHSDLGRPSTAKDDLSDWADQGVLLLNSVLTVEANKAASHQGRGWEIFTDNVIKIINDQKENVVFILWGAYAQKKGQWIDRSKHLVIESVHPSPLSSHRGFFGSKPFSKANAYLSKYDLSPIEW